MTEQTVVGPQAAPRRQLIGGHMSAGGGPHKAVERGEEIGCTAIQLFTRNPTQWKSPALTDAKVQRFHEAMEASKIAFAAAHDSYLINLATPDRELRNRSIGAFVDELDRAEALGIPVVVTHLGAHMGEGDEAGLAALVESLNHIANLRPGSATKIALETTAGQGTSLGWRFEHLAEVLEGVEERKRLVTCFDTCHVHAAGYDLSTDEASEETWRSYDRTVGIDTVALIHMNDAKAPRGKRVDRHEHIGQGQLGLTPFRWILTSIKLAHVPKVVETPQADTMHRENVTCLRRLAGELTEGDCP